MNPDDRILDDLRRVLDTVEMPPPESVVLAEAALDWRHLDAELAELVHDSAIDEPELVMRSGTAELRVLSFASGDVRIEVEYANRQLVGQVAPAEVVVVELFRHGNEPARTVTTDDLGTFVIDDVAPGPLSIVCRAADGRWGVRTSWTAV